MDADLSVFLGNKLVWIICGGAAVLMLAAIGALFFVSRKSQKVMESLLGIMLQPDRVRIHDASRVLRTLLADEITKSRRF